MKHLNRALAFLLVLCMALGCITVTHAADPEYNWVSTWATAEEKCDVNSDRMPQMNLNGTTVREIIRVTTTGETMKLKFSNQYGNSSVTVQSLHIAKQVQADKSTIDLSTDTVVTVGGKESFVIPAGQTIETDPVHFPVQALENVAVSMYFGASPTSNITGHRGARATTYQISGNQVSSETFGSGTKTTTSWFFLCDVALDMPEGSRAVVCFGDSITDGYGTDADYLGKKPDSYTRWGDYFAKRLQADDKTKNISVLNEGIGSNGMLDAYPTDAGRTRFARDLLQHDGVGYLIIHFGVNDMNNLSNTNKYNSMITEYKKMIDLAHENGIWVYVAPILPFKGNSYYSAASEQLRTMVNDWFRSADAEIDGIIDFEGAVVDPSDPTKIQEKYTHSDGLHPYDGYSAMADAIDLSLFYNTDPWAPCDHELTAVVTAPTCTTGGYTDSTCAKCGKVIRSDLTDALGHDWDEGTVTIAPTETSAGLLTFACSRCDATRTRRIPPKGVVVPEDIDFTDPAAADQFEIVNKASSAIREGQGLYMITTKDAFEPANGQLSGDAATTPRDLVKVPVDGDWQATLKFNFSQGSASNGYYQFFGFYAMQDYNNCAGIRGGNNDLQDFVRVNGEITAETDAKVTPGLGSPGTYWFRITKEGTSYTCARSSDGETFTDIFSYPDTDIEAECIAIDAYTGMTAGYEFLLQSLTFEAVGGVTPQPCDHAWDGGKVTTEATCTAEGVKTYTCSKCGETKTEAIAALDHSWDEGVTTREPTTTEEGVKTFTCTRCKQTRTEKIDKLPADHKHEYTATVIAPTCTEEGYTIHTCSCGDSYKDTVVAALGHKWDDGVFAEPTCTTLPTATYTCTVCGEQKVNILPGGSYYHPWDEGVITKPATATEEGEKTYTCTLCGATQILPYNIHEDPMGCPSRDFTDVPGITDWSHAGIDYCVARGLMNGTSATLFSPKGSVTRAQLVTILYRVAGTPEVTEPSKFTDVPADQWYTDPIAWAAANGIVTGMNATTFAPMNKITREQIATILYRYTDGATAEGSIDSFPDAPKVSGWAKDALTWAVANELITGVKAADGTVTLNPTANATRAQIASIIMRYLEAGEAGEAEAQ